MSVSLEEKFKILEKMCDDLSRGDLPLEQSLALYENAVALEREISTSLASAERRVVEIIGEDGTVKKFSEKRGQK